MVLIRTRAHRYGEIAALVGKCYLKPTKLLLLSSKTRPSLIRFYLVPLRQQPAQKSVPKMHGIRIIGDISFSLLNRAAGAYRLIRMILISDKPPNCCFYQGIWDFLMRNGSLDTCETADCGLYGREANIKLVIDVSNTEGHATASSKVCSNLPISLVPKPFLS